MKTHLQGIFLNDWNVESMVICGHLSPHVAMEKKKQAGLVLMQKFLEG